LLRLPTSRRSEGDHAPVRAVLRAAHPVEMFFTVSMSVLA